MGTTNSVIKIGAVLIDIVLCISVSGEFLEVLLSSGFDCAFTVEAIADSCPSAEFVEIFDVRRELLVG
jgi:hypothetical protein